MRPWVLLVGVLTLLVPPVAADPEPEEPPHSPNVAHVGHDPDPTPRGVDVVVTLQLLDMEAVDRVSLTYCRAEQYACAPSVPMTLDEDDFHRGTMAWHSGFFAVARHVGYNVTIHSADGSRETSPRENWPFTPDALPEGAGRYYFYALQGDAAAEAPSLPAGVVAMAAAFACIAARRRHGRDARPGA